MRYLRVLYGIIIVLSSLNNCWGQPATRSTVIEEKGVPAQNNYSGTTYAIIVGISNYRYLKSLTYADKDAELFKEFLMSPSGGNVKDSNIILVLNEEATDSYIYNFVLAKWISEKKIKANNRLFIYFSGHGDARDNREYNLLTTNTVPDNNGYRATPHLRMNELKNTISDLTKEGIKVILIIDACRTSDVPKPGTDNFNGITEQRAGEILILSASGGQKSIEDKSIGNGHGLFTWNLIDGLNGRADAELLGNKDGVVTYGELGTWLKITVASIANNKYHSEQVPTFYDIESQFPLAKVDSSYYSKWMLAKALNSGIGNDIAKNDYNTAGKKSVGGKIDSSALLVYNEFLKAIKKNKLTGSGSAEMFYDSLQNKYPGEDVTNDARYQLASAFIDFGQEKINLHVSGRENKRTVETLKSQIAGEKENSVLSESVLRMERVVNEKFTQAGYLMEKGINLLKNSNPGYLNRLRAKAKFLKAKGYYEAEPGNLLTLDEATKMAYEARTIDPDAAYINYLLGLLLALDYKTDSAFYYEHLASIQAPNWAYPLNQLGRDFEKRYQYDSAITYYRKAIETDYNFTDSYNNLAIVFKGIGQYDSAETYCRRGIKVDPGYVYLYCNLADVMRETKRYDSAEVIYKKAIAISPRYIYPYNNLGISFDNQHQYDSAVKYYKLALDIDPDYSYTLSNLGSVYRDITKYDSAYKYFNKAISLSPNSAYDLNGMGIVFYNQKKYDSAIMYYQKAFLADSNYHYALFNMGLVYYSKGNYDSSKYFHQQAVALNPAYVNAYNYLGLCSEKLNQPDTAIAYYRKAIAVNKDYYYAYYNLGYLYFTLGKFDSAQTNFFKSIAINQTYAAAYNSLGLNYESMGKKDSALFYYRKAVDIDAKYAFGYYNIGYIHEGLKNYDSAIIYYQKAASVNPTYTEAFNSMGLVFEKIKKYDSAVVSFKKAIDTDNNYSYAYYNLGRLSYTKGSYDTARTFFRKSVELDPLYSDSYNYLGLICNNKKLYDSAIIYYRKALTGRSPQLTVANNNIGNAYQQLKKYDSSIIYLKKSINYDPLYSTAYYNLAYSYELFYKPDSAIFYYKKYLALNPEFYNSNYYIAELYERLGATDSALTYYKLYFGRTDNLVTAGNIAAIYYNRKDYDSAIYYYEKIYTYYKDSSNETALERLAYSYIRKNNFGKGLFYFNTADRVYHDANSKYNLCCYYSLTGDKAKALYYFEEALKNNFTNFDHIQKDKDLDPIRQETRFSELLKQYFPDKYK